MQTQTNWQAVEDTLRGALDDGPDYSDLTPPLGSILPALGTVQKKKQGYKERDIRDTSNPWVCSVWFKGDAAPAYLVGNATAMGNAVCEFTNKSAKAMTATRKSWFTFGWPFLIGSHGEAIGKRPCAIVHRLKDKPDWSGTAAGLPDWKQT